LTQYTTRVYPLRCRNCGQSGFISIAQNGQRDWHFTAVGFFGLAVNRHNPSNSVLRCNSCGSSLVQVANPDVGAA
jgi:hypothetical protein